MWIQLPNTNFSKKYFLPIFQILYNLPTVAVNQFFKIKNGKFIYFTEITKNYENDTLPEGTSTLFKIYKEPPLGGDRMKQTLICLSGDPGAISGGFSTKSPA